MFRKIFYICLAMLCSHGFSAVRCGTVQSVQNSNSNARMLLVAKSCPQAQDNYEVHEKKTTNFIIYYKKEGVHAAKSEAYINSLAFYLEEAFSLHKNTLGMKEILPASKTLQYNKKPPAPLYPVEVIETGLRRYREEEGGFFGETISQGRTSQIIIDNNFLEGANCSGKISSIPFRSPDGLDYSVHWTQGLKIAAFHELYHAFQIPYLDLLKYGFNDYGFWLEASATGVEEIGAPEVDDYIGWLKYGFKNLGISMEDTPFGEGGYSYAALYLFLYSKLGPKFDATIWEGFSKEPTNNFSMQLARLANLREIDAEDLFHEYATQIFYSGQRTKWTDSPFWPDMPKWPNWRPREAATSVLPAGAFDFVRTKPSQSLNAKVSSLQYGDSLIWVLSRLLKTPLQPNPLKKEFAAYPNPWNPKQNHAIYFKDLPENSSGVEIRSSNGALIERIKGEAESELKWEPKKLPAPGILYYRYLPYGKTKKLIVQH